LRSLVASKLPPSFTPSLVTEAGVVRFVSRGPLGRIAGVATLVAFLLAAVYARHSVTGSFERLRDLHPLPLALGASALLVTLAASAAAWRCALHSAGAELSFRTAWGCYGLGSLANAALPARLGEAVRIGLFAARLDRADRRWVSGGACLAVAAARALVYALTCGIAAAAGILPGWVLGAPLLVAGTLALALASVRRRGRGRLSQLGLAAGLSQPAGAKLLGWAALAAGARLAGAVAVLAALDIASPVRAAFIGLTALAVASAVPLAPGSAGVAGAGMALALGHAGLSPATAVAAAVAFHGVETFASLVFGSAGWMFIRASGTTTLRQPAREVGATS
jgi:uncharacterized membrane protein YbhN (UPF0104 family)